MGAGWVKARVGDGLEEVEGTLSEDWSGGGDHGAGGEGAPVEGRC